MKVGFATFQQYHRKANIGSTRIRCEWPVKYWDDAEIYHIGRKYDVMIYQKCYWVDHAKQFDGVKILDLCDADWLSWGYAIVEMIENVDAITCSSRAIAEFIVNVTDKPVWVIPDRLDLDSGELPVKDHKGHIKKVIWFGYQHNQEQIGPALSALIKRDLELIVISEKPYIVPSYGKKLEIINLPWSEHWMNDILKGDVVMCPNNKKGRFFYKSDNKIIQSWALGMPVACIDKDLDRFKSEDARKEEAEKNLKVAHEKYNVKDSVKEYQELIQDIYDSKKNN